MSKLKRAFSDPSVDPEVEEENGETGKPQGLRVVKGLGVLPRSRIAGASKYNIAELAVGDAFGFLPRRKTSATQQLPLAHIPRRSQKAEG